MWSVSHKTSEICITLQNQLCSVSGCWLSYSLAKKKYLCFIHSCEAFNFIQITLMVLCSNLISRNYIYFLAARKKPAHSPGYAKLKGSFTKPQSREKTTGKKKPTSDSLRARSRQDTTTTPALSETQNASMPLNSANIFGN